MQLNDVQHIVTLQQQDAARFAKTLPQQKATKATQQYQQQHDFDILLVDPPRQGLDPIVCNMILQQHHSFSHILYISCGHDALLRDLDRLCCGEYINNNNNNNNNNSSYRVVDCVLLDLFPGTFSIETLIHLKKRNEP
jgi:tRNA/tmRNA/rRNA uracil-C5-methylase (TrmA/RlmC/RlmD family)